MWNTNLCFVQNWSTACLAWHQSLDRFALRSNWSKQRKTRSVFTLHIFMVPRKFWSYRCGNFECADAIFSGNCEDCCCVLVTRLWDTEQAENDRFVAGFYFTNIIQYLAHNILNDTDVLHISLPSFRIRKPCQTLRTK